MAKSAKYLLIGSTEAYSGKSATILGIADQLQAKGITIAYCKPLGTFLSTNEGSTIEEDVQFITDILKLPENMVRSPLLFMDAETIEKRLGGQDSTDYRQSLQDYLQPLSSDVILVEGAATLSAGTLFNLSLPKVAQTIDAAVLLVARFHSVLLADALLFAKQRLGESLLGVLINDIPQDKLSRVKTTLKPFLERQEIPVLGMLPRNNLLRSVSVRELVRQLQANVLCCPDRLDLMVETLTIGAMNVNAALKYLRKGVNMAVVTGGDRPDLQMAALETSTHCLILTGQVQPQSVVLRRAEEFEIPVLSVDLDTLTTVEIIDNSFGQVHLHEAIKVECMQQMMNEYFDIERLIKLLGLKPAL